MSKKQTLIPEKIHFNGFRIIRGEINSEIDFDDEAVKGHQVKTNFDLAFSLDGSMVKAEIDFKINTESEIDQEEASAFFSFVFFYQVENLSDLVKIIDKTEQLEVDNGLANALASMTYSTSRGVLLTRLQGTALGTFILPVIDPNELLNGKEKKKP